MKQDLYTIQEVSSLLGVSPKTLRRWEEKGMIKPIRTAGNQRRYRVEDVKKLERRRRLKEIRREIKDEVAMVFPVSQPTVTPVMSDPLPQPAPQVVPSFEPAPQVVPSVEPTQATPFYKRSFARPFAAGLAAILFLFGFATLWQGLGYPGLHSKAQPAHMKNNESAVLGSTASTPVYQLSVNVPGIFGKKVSFLDSVQIKKGLEVGGIATASGGIRTNGADINAGKGRLTASNVIYSLVAGSNITISGDKQNPIISAGTTGVSSFQGQTGAVTLAQGSGISLSGLTINNTGVLSVQGTTGAVTFSGGNGISISGTTITNSDTGSSQNIFKTFSIAGTDITASNNNDTINFAAGSGISLTGDAGSKTVTITSTSSGGTLSGLTTNGVLYATSATSATTTTPGTNGQIVIGVTGGAPVFANVTAGSGIGVTNGAGSLTIANNGVTSLTGTANQVLVNGGTVSQTGAITLTLPQNIGIGSTPTFGSLTLSAASNQLTLGSGNTATITTGTLTGAHTYTLPDGSGTFCLVELNNCVGGGGGGIGGSGSTNFIPKFTGATSIGDSDIFDSGGKVAVGTTSPQGLFSVSGGSAGQALVSLNNTATDQNILVGSASGTTRFVFDSTGNLNIIGGSYQIGGTSVLSSTTLGTGILSSSLTSVGALNGGSITNGFGNIDTGGNITAEGATGFTTTGTNAGLTFSTGTGNHIISASAGTLELGTATLAGDITGNSKNVTGLNNLSAGGTVTFSGLTANQFVKTTTGGQLTTSQFVNLTSDVTGVLPVANGGTGADLTAGGLNAQGSIPYFNNSGVLTTLAPSTDGFVLATHGAGNNPTWVNAASLGTNYWQLANGALSPLNETNDLLLGSTATTSAKFAFENVASGVPTASISANTANNYTYLTGDGTLATTDKQTLTIGSASTGNIVVNGIGTGVVQANAGVLSTGAVTNAELQNSSINLSYGTGISGGASVALGGTLTLNNTGVTSALAGTGIGVSGATGAVTITNNGVLSITGGTSGSAITGALTVTNSTTAGTTVTLDKATTTTLGIASFSSSNFSVTTGAVSIATGGVGPTELASTAVTANTYGGAGNGVGQFTVDQDGRITAASNRAIDLSTADVTGILGVAKGGTGADLTAGGLNAQGSIPYFNNSGVLTTLAPSTSGFVLETQGASANPTWVNAASLGTNYWQLNSGALAPLNTSNDLLLGSTATTSAKFAFENVASGVPTASISANTANNYTYLTGDGTLATTDKQTLTIGSASTGNIVVNGIGTGVVQANAGVLSTGLVQNNELQNNSITVTGGTGLGVSGSPVALGGTLTLSNTGVTSAVAGTGIGVSGATGAVTITNNGVLSITGGTSGSAIAGALTLTNSTTAGTTVTLDKATTTTLGIASFSSSNFSVTTGAVSIATGGVGPTELASTAVTANTYGGAGNGVGQFTVDADGRLTAASNRAIDLSTTDITGTLGVGHGGTGTATAFTQGSLVFAGASGVYSQDNSNLFYNATSGLLGVGTNAPVSRLDVEGAIAGKALSIFNYTSTDQNIIVASKSGTEQFAVNANGNLQFLGNSSGLNTITSLASQAQTLQIPDIAGATDSFCLKNAANCFGSGGGITGSGTNGQLAYFNGSGSITSNAALTFDATNKLLGIGTASPVAPLQVNGAYGGNAAAVINQLNSGNIFTASASGTTEFTIANNGNIQFIGNSSGLNTITSLASQAQTVQIPDIAGATDSFCLKNAANCFGSGGGITGSGTNGQLAFFNGSGSITSNAALTFDATNKLLGLGTSSPLAQLQVNGAYGGNAAEIVNQLNSGDIFTASASGVTKFTIANDGTLTDSKYAGGGNNNAILYATTTGAITATAVSGSNNLCLLSGASGPSWGSCVAGNTSWLEANGTIYPGNSTEDLLVGGTATASANFAVSGIDSNSPVASLSAFTNSGNKNGISLTSSTSTIQSLNNASLVLGGATTGNITLAPLNGVAGAYVAPNTNNQVDLGLSTLAFRNIYAGTDIKVGGVSVCLSDGTHCQAGAANYWDSLNGVLTPKIETQDLLLGSQASTSADFAFTGVNSATPVASISAFTNSGNKNGLSLNASTSTIQSLNNNTLTLGGNTTGSIQLVPGGSAALTALSNGSVGIGTASPTSLFSVGNTSQFQVNSSGAIAAATGITSSGTIVFSGLGTGLVKSNSGTLGLAVAGTDYQVPLTFNNGLTNTSNTVQLGGTLTQATSIPFGNNTLTLGDNTGTGNLVVSPNAGGQAALIVNKQGGNDIFTASASGATKFTIANDGTLTDTKYTGAAGVAQFNSSGVLSSSNLNLATGPVTGTLGVGNGGTGVGSFGGTNTLLYTTSANTLASITTANNAALITDGSGAPGWTSATANQVLRANGSGTVAFGSLDLSQNATVGTSVLGTTNGGTGLSSYTKGDLLYASGTNTLAALPIGTGTQVLGISSGVPAWISSSSLNFWQEVSGTLSPINSTDDLLLGATATTSAKFAFINNGSTNTPVASISAGLAGATYLTAAGTLQTTNNQSLLLNPNGGNVGIGLAAPISALDVNGAISTHGSNAGINIFSRDNSSGMTLYSDTGGDLNFYISNQVRAYIGQNGRFAIGQGNTAPLATLDVQGTSAFGGTTPIASFSGTTAFAGVVVDNSGSGDLFTASKSGATKFTILNNGNLALNNYANCGMLTTVSTVLTCSSAPAASTNYFQLNNGAISPFSSTADLLLGSTASTSADFAFTGVDSATPVASISAFTNSGNKNGISLNASTSTIQSLLNNTLTLGGNTTGSITLVPGGTTALTALSNGNLVANGTLTGLTGLTSSGTIQLTGLGASAFVVTDGSKNLTTSAGAASSAELASILSDETGSGVAVFGTSPTFTTSIDGSAGTFGLLATPTTINFGLAASSLNMGASGGTITVGNNGSSTITTGTNGNLTLTAAGSGNLTLSSDFNSSVFVGNATTPAPLSISGGIGNNGALIVNQLNSTGDLIDASASGTTKFQVQNDGTIIDAKYTGSNNAVLYATSANGTLTTTTTTSTANQCLLSGASTPTWGSCDLGTTSWVQANGTIYPGNSTEDLLIGGTATTSADFAFSGVDSTNPTASISAFTNSGNKNGLSLSSSTSTIQSLNKNTLTIGGNTTGDISFQPGGVSAGSSLYLASSGNVGINTNVPAQALTVGGGIAIDSNGNNNGFLNLNGSQGYGLSFGGLTTGEGIASNRNSGNQFGLDFYTNYVNRLSITNSGNIGINTTTPTARLDVNGTASVSGQLALYGTPQIQSTANQTLTLGGNTTGNISLVPGGSTTLTAIAGKVGIGTTAPVATLDVRGNVGTIPVASISGNTALASLFVDNSGSGDIFTASKSGATKFVIDNAGNVGIGTSTPQARLDITSPDSSGTTGLRVYSPDRSEFMSLGYDSAHVVLSSGGQAIILAGAIFNAGGTFDNGNHILNDISQLGVGTTSSFLATADIRATTATLPVASISGNTTFANTILDQSGTGDIFTASKSGATKFTILNNGNIQANNYNSNNGLLYTNGTGVFQQLAIGGSGTCLMGGASLTWSSCAAGSNLLQENLGALAPANITDDLLLGGTATTSADFAFTGVDSATPVASISAFTNSGNKNGISLNASTSTIQSLMNNTLTLGGTTTGNISFRPGGQAVGNSLYLASSGFVGVGTAAPNANLEVDGTVLFSNNSTQSFKVQSSDGSITALNADTQNGRIGINTKTPVATLDVRGLTGSAPVASFSGATAIANTIIDQSGTGDIFSASASGLARFTIQNNGDVIVSSRSASAFAQLGAVSILPQTSGTRGLVIQAAPVQTADLFDLYNSGGNFVAGFDALGAETLTKNLTFSSATGSTVGQINSSANQNIALTPGAGGFVGIGTVSMGNAELAINQSGAGDILTASLSGATKFTVTNAGNVQINNLANNSAVYTDASHTLTTTAPTSGVIGYLQRNNGALAPTNLTDDLLLGSTATTGAKFAFTGVAGGTPTASISAGTAGATSLTANGTLGTTNSQTLQLGSSTTGQVGVGLAPAAAFGNTRIGSGGSSDNGLLTAQQFTTPSGVGGTVTSMSVYIHNGVTAGAHAQMAIYADTTSGCALSATDCPGSLIASTASTTPLTNNAWNTMAISATLSPNTTYWFAYWTDDATQSDEALVTPSSAGNFFVFGSASYTGTMPGTFPTITFHDSNFDASIYATFSGSSGPAMVIDPTSGIITTGYNEGLVFSGPSGYISNSQGFANSEVFGASAQTLGQNTTVLGNTASANADKATVIGSNASANTSAIALGYATSAGGASSLAIGDLASAANTSSIAIGYAATTTAANQLVVGGPNTNSTYISSAYFGSGVTDATPQGFTLNATGGNGTNIAGASLTLAGGKGTGNAAGGSILFQTSTAGTSGSTLQSLATRMSIDNSGNVSIANLGNNSVVYTDGSHNLTTTAPTTGIIGYWQRASGALSPANITDDLLLGSTATTSADFAFTGVDSATPIASVSAFTNSGNKNGISLNASTSTIQSLNMNTLTLGGATTGNVVLAPAGTTLLTATTNGISIPNLGTSANFQVGTFMTLDMSSNRLTLGSVGNCTGTYGTGRLCINNGIAGGGTNLNQNSTTNVTGTGGTDTGNAIFINDTSSSTGNTLQGMVIDTTGTTNGSSTVNSLIIKVPSNQPGNFLQFLNGSANKLQLTNTGSLSLGTATPLATLDVRGNTGSSPVASISGNTAPAAAIIDQSGTGDIFTASKSGATKFVITNSGNIEISNGSSLVAGVTNAGLSCASVVNGIVTGTGSCVSGNTSWSQANGVIYEGNTTQDLLLGGTATTSAKFAFIGVNTTSPVASISAQNGNGTKGLVLDGGNGAIQSLNKNTLTLGGNTTGDISFNPGNIGAGSSLYLASSGRVGIGTTSPLAQLDVRGNSGTTPVASISGATSFAGLVVDNSGSGDLFTASKSGATKFVIKNNGDTQENGNLIIADPTGNRNAGLTFDGLDLGGNTFQLYSAGGGLNFYGNTQDVGAMTGDTGALSIGGGNVTPTAQFDALASDFTLPGGYFHGSTGKAMLEVNQLSNSGDLFTASVSGATKFVVNNAGNVGIGTAAPATALDINAGSTAGNGIRLTGTATDTDLQLINASSGGLDWQFDTIGAANSFFPAGAMAIQTFGQNPLLTLQSVATVGGTGGGQIGINVPAINTAPIKATLDVRGNLATIPVASFSGGTNFAAVVVDQTDGGDIFTASKSGATKFTIKNSGTVVIGNSTNGITFDPSGNTTAIYAGTARPTKQIVLSPEYAGAVLTASGAASANTNGFMTSDASPSANYRNYYDWTSTQTSGLMQYTIAVRTTLPKDFSAWATSGNAMTFDIYTNLASTGSNKVDIVAYKASDGSVVLVDQGKASSSNKVWRQLTYSSSSLQALNPGDTIVFYITMYAMNGMDVQVGDIVLNYLSAF